MRVFRKSNVVTLAGLAVLVTGACSVAPTGSPTISGPRSLAIPGDSLYALAMNPSKWSAPYEAERDCVGPGRCEWMFFRKKVKVAISAERGAKDLGPNPQRLTLVGKLVNKGDATEAMYRLENGPYQFLLFVMPGAGANGKWIIERVDSAPPHNHVTVAEGKQVGCNHAGDPWGRSFAEFRSCAEGRPPRTAGIGAGSSPFRTAGLMSFSLLNLLRHSSRDPAWVTCTSGCCVSDY